MERRKSERPRRILFVALLAGILWAIPIRSAIACHAFSFESATYTVAENAPSVAVVVTRKTDHQPSGYPSSVKVSTTDQTAESGQDYTEFNQAVSFGPGETSKRIEIAIKDDTAYEGSETFAVKLSTDPGSPTECTFGYGGFAPDPNPATVTIQDNDLQSKQSSPPPGSQTATKPPATHPGSTSPGATGATATSPSPTAEEIGPNVSGDVPKQSDGGPPIGTILLIAGIVVVVAGAIGGYVYLGSRD